MKVIFFDGYCNICDTYVKWVYKYNIKNDLYFASQQGEYAADFFAKNMIDSQVSYIIFHDGKSTYKGAKAILEILKYIRDRLKLLQC